MTVHSLSSSAAPPQRFPPSPGRGEMMRFIGIDFARFLAVVGMMWTHLVVAERGLGEFLAAGNASTLFAVVGGMSVVLATRGYLERGEYAAARWAMAARGLIVIVIGLSLASIPQAIVVVLVYFGAAMLLTAAFLTARTGWLLAAAGVLAVAGPLVNAAVRQALGIVEEGGALGWPLLQDPVQFFRALMLTGTYPVITWLAYLLIGMVLARLLLAARASGTERSLLLWFGGTGAVLLAVSYVVSEYVYATVVWPRYAADGGLTREMSELLLHGGGFGAPAGTEWSALLLNTPHTGTPFDMLRGVGVALIVLAAMLTLARVASPRVLAVLRPVSAAGAAPLTIYTLHVAAAGASYLALMAWGDLGGLATYPWWIMSVPLFLLHLAGALLVGVVLASLRKKGPLETVVGFLSKRAARLGLRER